MSDPLVTRAHRTPHHRVGIRELTRSAPTRDRLAALSIAALAADERAMLALALSLASESALPVERLPDVLPDVEEPALAAALVSGGSGDRLSMLGRLLDEEILTEEVEAALVLVATRRLGLTSPLPAPWLLRMRRLARRLPTVSHAPTAAYLRAFLVGLEEPVLAELLHRAVGEAAPAADVEALLEAWDGGLDAVLGDEEAPRVVATVTVKSDTAKIGRNDPCPCGSGKKFKKCHGKDTDVEARGPIDAAALSGADLQYLRMADLAALDLGKLKKPTLEAALARAITYRRWALAERIAERLDGGGGHDARLSLALGAIDSGRADVADRLIDGWPGELPSELFTHRELRRIAPSLEELSRMTATMMADAKAPLFELGLGLLHRAPGLGIPFARGLVAELPAADGDTLIEEIERARDVLALPPGDPARAIVDALDEDDERHAAKTKADEALNREWDVLRATLARKEEDLSARQAEVTSLSMRLEEAEDEVARLSAHSGAKAESRSRPTGAEGEKKKWGARIEELKALVQEGNKERAALRRQITELSEELETRQEVAGAATTREEPEADSDASPRAPVIPVFSRAATAALPSLPLRIRRQAIELSGTLAAGDPAAWRNVKQMEGVAKVWSARLGIHHRLLFRAHDESLEVLDVVTREDLMKSLERWR